MPHHTLENVGFRFPILRHYPLRTVSPAPAGPETPNNGTAFRFKLLFADHAAELWPQISFDVRKSIALFIDHFSLSNSLSNMHPLIDQRFKCSACDLIFVSLWLFVTRDKADAWATNTALVNR